MSYYQIPLSELRDIIDVELSFLSKLKVNVYPFVGDIGKEYCNISYASWDWKVWLHVCFFEINNSSALSKKQKEQVEELLEELHEIYDKFDFDIGLYLEDLPEDFKGEYGNVYEKNYKRIA